MLAAVDQSAEDAAQGADASSRERDAAGEPSCSSRPKGKQSQAELEEARDDELPKPGDVCRRNAELKQGDGEDDEEQRGRCCDHS